MHPLKDPQDLPLSHWQLIEASAGTGKTYTLTQLYTRLLIEKMLLPEDILVMTFTKDATRELKSRIQTQLLEWQAHLSQPHDETLPAPLRRALQIHPLQLLQKHLSRVITHFDQAQIFTFHGFCQRLLNQYATEAGLQHPLNIQDDHKVLKVRLIDFWWQHLNTLPKSITQFYHWHNFTAEQIESPLRDLFQNRGKLALPALSDDTLFLSTLEQWHLCYHSLRVAFYDPILLDAFHQLHVLNAFHGNRLLAAKRFTAQMQAFEAFFKPETLTQQSKWALKPTLEALSKLKEIDKLVTQKGLQHTGKDFFEALKSHLFFTHLDNFITLYQQLETAFIYHQANVCLNAFHHIHDDLRQYKLQSGQLAYDDLQVEALNLLRTQAHIRDLVQQRIHAILVDEFQDTDALQYALIQQIDPLQQKTAIFVGDPKQAIYSFRGGDIYTYLRAKNDIPSHAHYTLKTNYRSQLALIEQYNAIYQQCPLPFLDEAIHYHPIEAGLAEGHWQVQMPHQLMAPLYKHKIHVDDKTPKALLHEHLLKHTLKIVQDLTHNDITIQDKTLPNATARPIHYDDILILVRTNTQAREVYETFNQAQIPCHFQTKHSLFDSHHALYFWWWIEALNQPYQLNKLKRLTLIPYYSDTLKRTKNLLNASAQERYLQTLRHVIHLMKQHGIAHAFFYWLDNQWASYFYQNTHQEAYLHWLQLIDIACQFLPQHHYSLNAFSEWLEKQLHTETLDDNFISWQAKNTHSVRVMTVHGAKGLEAPVVICPFLHLPHNLKTQPQWQWGKQPSHGTLNLQLKQAATEAAAQTHMAEELRLQYVALTRANAQCHLLWLPESHSNGAPLTYLLADHHTLLDAEWPVLPTSTAKQTSDITIHTPEKLDQSVNYEWYYTSFSALARLSHLEDSKHDEAIEPIFGTYTPAYPRGINAGLLLHDCLEKFDFQTLQNASTEILLPQIQPLMAKYAIDTAAFPALYQLLRHTINTPLLDDCLHTIPHEHYSKEFGVLFDLQHLNTQALVRFFQQYYGYTLHIPTLHHYQQRQMVNGFIDWVGCIQNKYYIIDYKSNDLGENYSNYTPEKLNIAMQHSLYHLQYWLYLSALDRHLHYALPEYQPETHLGGVWYLFVRGLDGMSQDTGVYFQTAQAEMLQAFNACFLNQMTDN